MQGIIMHKFIAMGKIPFGNDNKVYQWKTQILFKQLLLIRNVNEIIIDSHAIVRNNRSCVLFI